MSSDVKNAMCIVAIVIGLTVVVAASGKAATVSFTTSTPIPSTLTDWSSSLAFPEFNPAIGTLTQVALQFSGSLGTTIMVTDLSGSGSTGHVNTEVQLSVNDPLSLITGQPQLDYYSPNFVFSVPALSSTTSPLLSQSQTSTVYNYSNPSILSEFTGLGSVSLSASTQTYTNISYTSGNVSATQTTDAGATGTVTYTYTPVPEPSTIALLGVGVVGLLGYARRRGRN